MTRDAVAYGFSAIVVAAWVVCLAVGMFTKDYTGLTVMTPLLMMVGGFLLGYGPKGGNDKRAE